MGLSFIRDKPTDKDIVKKSKSTISRSSVKRGNSPSSNIDLIVSTAETKLAHHKNDYIIINDKNSLETYLFHCLSNGIASIDTETTGLNPLEVDLVGICLYTPKNKACYVPIGHKSYITNSIIDNQLNIDDVRDCFLHVMRDIRWIMHNAKYDIRVLRHTLDIDITCYWDTMLAGYCIDENESHSLKDLHLKYCNSKDTESLKFDTLFSGITFDKVPIDVAYLYAAGDAIKTYELFEYQKKVFSRHNNMSEPYSLFKNIEMPLIKVVADMEDRGVSLDFKVSEYLQKKYEAIKDEKELIAQTALSKYESKIENYRKNNPNCKLSNPILLSSPTQLAILFYDILKLKSPSKKSPRGTGEDILKHFCETEHKELCQAILDIRNVNKLLNTYIEKMPKIVSSDGRIHANFNQYGAKTGRFSSSDPNLQNIPSHNKEIRQMFKAQDGYMLVGADYSQQEPMVTAYLSKDLKMQDAFIHGKDIYSTIASLAFHKDYKDCLEFRDDGSLNSEGKERRSQAKSIVLGILYGRQIPSIAEQLNVTTKEAQNIYDSVLRAFPQLANFIVESQSMAKINGYVTTAWGRRRHLPDIQLEKYEFSKSNTTFDPMSFDKKDTKVSNEIRKKYIDKLRKSKSFSEKLAIIDSAKKDGINIKDNSGFIAQAERQCVNARVQGSAADMVKIAMIQINNDSELKALDFHLLLQVHDEVIGECPSENVDKVQERLSYVMRTAPTDLIKLPFKCDCAVVKNWC